VHRARLQAPKIYPVKFFARNTWIYSSSCTQVEGALLLQPGRSPIKCPGWGGFLNLRNPSSRTLALVSSHPLTEMNTRNFPGGKKRLARRADNLVTMRRVSENVGASTSRKPKGLHGLYRGNICKGTNSGISFTPQYLIKYVSQYLQQRRLMDVVCGSGIPLHSIIRINSVKRNFAY
jgi:hypothetical protein